MRLHFYKDMFFLFLFFAVVFLTISCGRTENKSTVKIEYKVCRVEDLPDELFQLIEDKKERPFQFTYENSAYLYIAAGYGRQKTASYAVGVKSFKETDAALIVDMILLGKRKAEEDGLDSGEAEACPYIVLKCQKPGKTVVFEN